MTDSKRIVKNTMYLYLKTGLTLVIVLYTTRIILNSLGEVDFGIFNIIGGVISMLGFLNTAMAVTIQRFLNFEQGMGNLDKRKSIFSVGVVFHAIIAVIFVLVLLMVGLILFNGILNIPEERIESAKIIYGGLIVSTFFTILTVPYDACLNAHENMLYYSIVGIIEAILKLTIALIIIRSTGDKLALYGVLMALVPIFSMALMRVYCHMNYEECNLSIRKYYDKSIAKEMRSFASWILLGSFSNYLGNYGNLIVMNHYFGAALNAVMGIANQIQGQLMVLSTGMLKALNPVIAKEEGAGKSQLMLAYSLKGCEFSYFLLAIFSIPFIVDAPVILKYWLVKYPEWTVLFVRLQLVRALLEQITVSLNKALEAKNKIKSYNVVVFIFNLLPIPILCFCYKIGLPHFIYFAVTISFMVIIPTLSKYYLCSKYCDLRFAEFIKIVLAPITIATVCSFFVCSLICTYCKPSIGRLALEIMFTCGIIVFVFYESLSKKQRLALSNKVFHIIKSK